MDPVLSVLYIGIAQAVFVAVFMLCKRPNTLSDKIVAVWMLFLASPMLFRLGRSVYPDNIISRLFSISSFPLTFGPFLWLYTSVLVDKKRSITRRDLWHFVPFALFALIQIVFPAYPMPSRADVPQPSLLDSLTNPLSSCCYSGMVLWRLRQHRRKTLNYFSSLSLHVTLKWLQWLTIGFVISFLLPIANSLWPLRQLSLAHTLSFTGFIYVLSFFGLQQPLVFQKSDEPEVSDMSSPEALPLEEASQEEASQKDETPVGKNLEQKYQRSGLTQVQAQRYLQRLEEYMRQERPYLEADLTIEALAKRIHISRHFLTQILNEHFGKNFYLYVNEYRINDVKQRLIDPDNVHLTILAIAYESGFNSKSTFNTMFKKITHMTPSQFRKSQVRA